MILILLISSTAFAGSKTSICAGLMNPAVVTEGSSDPFSKQGYGIKIQANALKLNSMTANAQGKDLILTANARETGSAAVPLIEGQMEDVVLASAANRIVLPRKGHDKMDNVFPLDFSYGDTQQNVDVLRKYVNRFYGFHFVAEAKTASRWKLIVTTEVSKRSRELRGTVAYEAIFDAPADGTNYVALPFQNSTQR